MPTAPAFSPDIDAFVDVLGVGGLAAALDFLNVRTAYRFTFIYRFEPPCARRIMVYDRDALYISGRDRVPVAQTFFEFMLDAPSFATADGLADTRSARHPGSLHFRGFCGIQLLHADGRHYGWLAHASPGAVAVPAQETEFLQQIAAPLMRVLETMLAAESQVDGSAPL